MPRKKRQRIHLTEQLGTVVLNMGPIEIWDGADLALLRETVTRLVQGEQRKSISIQMKYVKYVPSGFFGLLLDCFDHGAEVQLLAPNEHITCMLWFQQFCVERDSQVYLLHQGPNHDVPHDQPLPWAADDDHQIWNANEHKRSAIPAYQPH